ncbi:hypothetical protein RhiirA5_455835 [Rhizophagus irregularis]|uniref:Uncharacterized protein n=1 Tax=Rhizophagus irregularis TaxID=588596 RepID=A0A2N0P4I7_9GLOM|nr:hypothetical protein RhiirA5_455835 [Rhizophagus irregularis]
MEKSSIRRSALYPIRTQITDNSLVALSVGLSVIRYYTMVYNLHAKDARVPLGGDQMGNAQKLKTAGVALTLSVYNLNVNDILNKMSKLLEDEKIKKNLKRMEVLTKINSKRKYRAADLIEYILHSSGLEEYINDDYLKEWAPAASRMGFIKANNLDVYGALLGIVLTLIGGIVFKLFKLISNPSSIRIKSKKA